MGCWPCPCWQNDFINHCWIMSEKRSSWSSDSKTGLLSIMLDFILLVISIVAAHTTAGVTEIQHQLPNVRITQHKYLNMRMFHMLHGEHLRARFIIPPKKVFLDNRQTFYGDYSNSHLLSKASLLMWSWPVPHLESKSHDKLTKAGWLLVEYVKY